MDQREGAVGQPDDDIVARLEERLDSGNLACELVVRPDLDAQLTENSHPLQLGRSQTNALPPPSLRELKSSHGTILVEWAVQ